MRGVVYILTNPSMPGLVKIGRSNRSAEARANEIYQTGVPTPFEVFREFQFLDCVEGEKIVHEHLVERRVRLDREFFEATPEEADKIVENSLFEQVTCLVQECLPGFEVASEAEMLGSAEVASSAARFGVGFADVALALRRIPDDVWLAALGHGEGEGEAKAPLKVVT